ncbi:hypothetical protein C8R41DRAFT_774526 [Lentinula lateritia]|uniref:Uncharacterized protein n=1 Tax=Lentinula lateritia TaxID=40482 RepID=A0ABQ8V922_9AGAR|nr:hypothetical protein C8R41DRAFT_774526 [Lentinula lateritia]
MHLFSLNSPDLMILLWRGKFDCEKTDNRASWDWAVLQGNTWKEHGKAVASCTPYMPGSFDRPPRNPAEKINSGYKAWEFLLYFYGLGPCLFFGVLPDKYWEHYCKSVRVVQLLTQNSCNSNELNESNILFTKFSDEFESLYVQRRTDRIHFVRPSIHTPSHIPFETIRVGPGAIYSQWTMERTIGNLGEEIKQHANPYANISQRGVRHCQVNALVAAIPDLIPAEAPVHGSREFDNGYIFLAATDTAAREVTALEVQAIRQYYLTAGDPQSESWIPKVVRWARVKLPNGQIARSRWKEDVMALNSIRISRNVKVSISYSTDTLNFAYYFLRFKLDST